MSEQAATYDSRHVKLIERLTAELKSRLDFIGVDWADDDDDDEEEDEDEDEDASSQQDQKTEDVEVEVEKGKELKRQVRILDYACGTGIMSRALAPYVTQCVGIDLSENMVAEYNARARNQGLEKDEMFAVVGDLASATDPNPAILTGTEFRDFDLVVVGGGFHHFEDPALAATRLVERLRPGGVLLIWDFMPHGRYGDRDGGADGDDSMSFKGQAHHTITQHGFSESGIREIYEKAGAGQNFKLVELGAGFSFGHGQPQFEEERGKMRKKVFLSRGEKAGSQ